MAPIGETVQRENGPEVLDRARNRASLIPDLLVEAKRVANTIHSGWHGRRKRGVGENFWQFRPYSPGENMARIDWRRSARDEHHIYIQDKEWQATHTLWLWVDESPSMMFKSNLATVSKQSRALMLGLAMAELLSRSGERTGWMGLTKAMLNRRAADRIAEALLHAPPQTALPEHLNIGRHTDVIIISDFLGSIEDTTATLRNLSAQGARGHLVHLVDPVEETFPYNGRVEFQDPETGENMTLGNAQGIRDDYLNEIASRTIMLREKTAALNWSYTRHYTDQLASQALASLHLHLTERTF